MRRKIILGFLLGLIWLGIFALPSLAQDREIMLRTAQNMTEIEAWWDKLWDTTFNPPPLENSQRPIGDVTGIENPTNLSLYAFVHPVRFMLLIGIICWIYRYGYKMVEAKGAIEGSQVFLQMFFPLFLAMILLSHQAVNSRLLAYGLRELSNFWANGVMNLTIADFNVRAAIQDQLVTEDAKEIILQKWEACAAMPQPEVVIPSIYRPRGESNRARLPPEAANPPANGAENPLPPPPPIREAEALPISLEQRQVYDYLDCIQELSYYAEVQLNEAETANQCGGLVCKTFKNFYKVVFNIANVTYEEEITKRLDEEVLNSPETRAELDRLRAARLDPNAAENQEINGTNFGLGAEELLANLTNPSKPFLYFTQWMWVSSLELAMFLSALLAPIFIALSIIPGQQNMLVFWLIETLTIALAKLAYIVIIAIVAVQLADPTNFSRVLDNTFFMSLGIFAPAVSFIFVTAGGIAAASSFRSQAIGSVAMVAGVWSGAAATIGYSLARNFDRRR